MNVGDSLAKTAETAESGHTCIELRISSTRNPGFIHFRCFLLRDEATEAMRRDGNCQWLAEGEFNMPKSPTLLLNKSAENSTSTHQYPTQPSAR